MIASNKWKHFENVLIHLESLVASYYFARILPRIGRQANKHLLTAAEEIHVKVRRKRVIFQRDDLCPFGLLITLIIMRKVKVGWKLGLKLVKECFFSIINGLTWNNFKKSSLNIAHIFNEDIRMMFELNKRGF